MELLQVKMLNTAAERILNKELSTLGLTFTQATVIGYLLENQGKEICQRDIEYNLGLTHPTVSQLLSRMETNGLISMATSVSDRRFKKVTLTDHAISLSVQIGEKYKLVKRKLFDGISQAQREQFNATVRSMLKNIQED